jgi:hypothetical protein
MVFLAPTADCACAKLCGQRESSAVLTGAGIRKTGFPFADVSQRLEIYEFTRSLTAAIFGRTCSLSITGTKTSTNRSAPLAQPAGLNVLPFVVVNFAALLAITSVPAISMVLIGARQYALPIGSLEVVTVPSIGRAMIDILPRSRAR